jgi:hypothetical protein
LKVRLKSYVKNDASSDCPLIKTIIRRTLAVPISKMLFLRP